MNDNKETMVGAVCSILSVLPIGVGLILYKKLPEQIPSHFNAAGEVDGYMGRIPVILTLPLICLALCIIMGIIYKKKMEPGIKALIAIESAWPILSIGIQSMIFGYALGMDVNPTAVSIFIIGVICVACGNYMPTVRRNSVFGVRLPWTMDDDHVWEKTQRFCGKLMLALGILIIITAFCATEAIMIGVVVVGLLVLCVVAGIYSYNLAQK